MKAKIKTLIAIIALGTIGITNINAIADNKSMVNAEVVTEKEEMLTIESWMIDADYWNSKAVIDSTETEDSLKIESWMINESLWN